MLNPETADWTLEAYMLARAIDLLAAGNWQRGRGKGPKPKPIPRPTKKKRVGNRVMSLDDMDQFLGYSPRTQR